jgi:hypothetical protein
VTAARKARLMEEKMLKAAAMAAIRSYVPVPGYHRYWIKDENGDCWPYATLTFKAAELQFQKEHPGLDYIGFYQLPPSNLSIEDIRKLGDNINLVYAVDALIGQEIVKKLLNKESK